LRINLLFYVLLIQIKCTLTNFSKWETLQDFWYQDQNLRQE
jgi:hypothetical protein